LQWCDSCRNGHCNTVARLLQNMYTYLDTRRTHNKKQRPAIKSIVLHQTLFNPRLRYYILQHTSTHFNELQHDTMQCNTLQHTATQYNATRCNTLQHAATRRNTLQHTATHCNSLQHTATTHCNTLQHTATHCTTPQHSARQHKYPFQGLQCGAAHARLCDHIRIRAYMIWCFC